MFDPWFGWLVICDATFRRNDPDGPMAIVCTETKSVRSWVLCCTSGPILLGFERISPMDSFEWNKIAGAVLGTGLLVLGINIVVDEVMKPEKAAKPGIELADAGGEPGGGEKPVAEDNTPPDWGTVLPAADLAAGEKVHKKCQQCHTFDKDGKMGIGPNLWGIVGNKRAHMEGFAYSAAISSKTGPWNYDEINAFLKKPSAYAPGTKMAFAGLPKKEDRINVIAWLRAQADAPEAIPAPNPAAAVPVPAENATPTEGTAAPIDGAAPAPASTLVKCMRRWSGRA